MQTSFTCDAGLASSEPINAGKRHKESESNIVKPYLSQRYTKERAKDQESERGIDYPDDASALNFLPDHFTHNVLIWPLEDLFIEPADILSEHEDHYALDDERDILGWAVSVLSTSPTARLMIKEAMNGGWEVGLGSLGGFDFHLDVPSKSIILDNEGLFAAAFGRSAFFRNALLVSLSRALRDVWQEKRHGGFNDQYGPEDILLLERMRAADCDVITILIGWELRSEGFSDLWRHMIGSEEGDLAIVFSGYLERDPSSLFSGKALASAFHQWFQNEERINACDHETLEYLDDLVMAKGGERAFGSKKITPVSIEVLSCLPDKTAYLRGYGECIMRDPEYAGLCDSINQSHFLHLVRDLKVTYVQNVPFRDSDLAERIFPDGQFTAEENPLTRSS